MLYKQVNFSTFGADCFPGFVGIEVVNVSGNSAVARLEIKKSHFAPNGYVHTGSIITAALPW